ncbi:MAG: site-2 protease family protein [Actinobacteria bacterium]|nr:site-2 protease family protein [Actinomycetota bacterium]
MNIRFAVYLLIWLVPSLTLHEFGHAFMADRLGDRTARNAGRLTLNPIPHADPIGTVFLPAMLLLLVASGRGGFLPVFAYAKPTPVNPSNFRDPNRGIMWSALAGPAVNLLLAVVAALALRVGSAGELRLFLAAGLLINVVLFVFNLMPIPGLDGSKVLARFLPPRAREIYRGLDQYLVLFMLAIFFMFGGPVFAFVSGIGNGLCNILVGFDCL